MSANPSATSGEEGLRPQDWKMARGTSSGEALGGQIAQGDHTFRAEDAGFAYFDTVGVQVKTLPRISQINLD